MKTSKRIRNLESTIKTMATHIEEIHRWNVPSSTTNTDAPDENENTRFDSQLAPKSQY